MCCPMVILVNCYGWENYKHYTKDQRNNPIWLLQESFEDICHNVGAS